MSDEQTELGAWTDAELVGRYLASSDDEDQMAYLEELFGRHYEKVSTWCVRIAGDRDDAYDLAQGIFVRVQRNIASFRGEAKFSTWLYSITRSECMSFLKTRPSHGERVSEHEAYELADADASGPEEALEQAGAARMVRALLEEELEDVEKRVFTLHYGDEVPLAAITRLLSLQNRSGAKAFIVSARRKLARVVERLRSGDLPQDAWETAE